MDGYDESAHNGYHGYTECDVCKKRFYGYDDLCVIILDGVDLCSECALGSGFFHRDNKGYMRAKKNVWRIAHTFSSMYDGRHAYATSIEWIGKNKKIVRIRHLNAEPMLFNPGFGLSGHIDSDHFEVDVESTHGDCKNYAFIFEPYYDELEKMKRYPMEESE